MAHTVITRQEQKQRTRQALLDAALRLMEHKNLGSLGLREVTREAGIVPAAFYRHFRDLDDLGIALVEESLGSMLPVIRDARRGLTDSDEIVHRSLEVLLAYLDMHRDHFRVIAREKFGGVTRVRQVINAQLQQAADELADDLSLLPDFTGWDRADLQMLTGLLVNQMLLLTATLLDVPADQPGEAQRVVDTARRQLQLIIIGRRHWLDSPTGH
ncbi:MAG TPA: TetR family transcriptional regulator [Streptosporangiaceae bacterium]|jgi:AcrR family transcriptional regulator|nr:TetR family transcriptional regulator [Streptosporangiaceae bacterium]